MTRVEIRGAEQFDRLARRLREAGDKDLRRELYAALNRSTKPVRGQVKANARAILPQRGGAARLVARSSVTTRGKAGKHPSVRIVAKNGINLYAVNRGILRHPLFGRRKHWYTTPVQPGWFTDPIERAKPHIQRELIEAMHDIAVKITRG